MPAAPLSFRLATLNDAAPIAALSRDLIEAGLGWSWTRERVARAIAREETCVLVACVDAELAGFAIMDFGTEHAHLSLLAVRPERQGVGIGSGLLRWLEEAALTAGIGVVRLELRVRNARARRFYERHGFQAAGSVPNYYQGVESALRMTRDIRRAPVGPLPDWRQLLGWG